MADAVAHAHKDGTERQEHQEREHDPRKMGADLNGLGVAAPSRDAHLVLVQMPTVWVAVEARLHHVGVGTVVVEVEEELIEEAPEKIIPEIPPAEEIVKEEPEAIEEEAPPISEEKIEAILTKVVSDVLERVAREVIPEVAEKIIREEIDALKSSIMPDD